MKTRSHPIPCRETIAPIPAIHRADFESSAEVPMPADWSCRPAPNLMPCFPDCRADPQSTPSVTGETLNAENAEIFSAFSTSQSLRYGLFLFGDDLVFDLRVGGRGNDLLPRQIRLLGVRTAIDDLLRVGRSDARQSIQLLFGRGVDIEQIGVRRRGRGRLGL